MSVNLVVCHCDTFSNKQFNMKPKVSFYSFYQDSDRIEL